MIPSIGLSCYTLQLFSPLFLRFLCASYSALHFQSQMSSGSYRIPRTAPHGEKLNHAMMRSLLAGMVWQAFHAGVGFTLFLVGAALKGCYSNIVSGGAVSEFNSQLLGAACGFTVLICAFLRGLHKGILGSDKTVPTDKAGIFRRRAQYGLYLFIAICHFMVTAVANQEYLDKDAEEDYDTIFVMHMFFAILLNLTETIGSSLFNKKFEIAHSDRQSVTVSVQKLVTGEGGEALGASIVHSSIPLRSNGRMSISVGGKVGNEVEADLEFMLAKEDFRHTRQGFSLSSKHVQRTSETSSPVHHREDREDQ